MDEKINYTFLEWNVQGAGGYSDYSTPKFVVDTIIEKKVDIVVLIEFYIGCNFDAITQYYNQEKSDCYLLHNFFDIGIKIKHADRFHQWNETDLYQDILITDRNFAWTFAKTHEEMCGPYFAYRRHS